MQPSRQTSSPATDAAARRRVRDCCHFYSEYRLSPTELAVLTGLSVAVVESALDSLRAGDQLPIQYLDHRLN